MVSKGADQGGGGGSLARDSILGVACGEGRLAWLAGAGTRCEASPVGGTGLLNDEAVFGKRRSRALSSRWRFLDGATACGIGRSVEVWGVGTVLELACTGVGDVAAFLAVLVDLVPCAGRATGGGLAGAGEVGCD